MLRLLHSPRLATLALIGACCGVALVGCGSESGQPASDTSNNLASNNAAKPVSGSAAVASSSTAPLGWGTLRGKFVYDGVPPTPMPIDVNKDLEVCGKHPLVDESLVVDKSGGLANVVIYVRTKVTHVHPDYAKLLAEPVAIDNRGCRFEPHLVCVHVGQKFLTKNSDAVGHNTAISPLGDLGFSPLIPSGNEQELVFKRSQFLPTAVTCSIHPWMKGYVLIRDNPYFAVSAADGSFEIKQLPAGELEFQVWHEKKGYLAIGDWDKGRFTRSITVGDNDLGVTKISAAWFN